MAPATVGRRVWCLVVLMPMAFMASWSMLFGLAKANSSKRSPLFDTMTRIIPTQAWGIAWLIVGVCCLIGGVIASWQWLRVAVVLAWALATGALFSVMWARFVNHHPISMFGISWAYFLWAACGFSALARKIVPVVVRVKGDDS